MTGRDTVYPRLEGEEGYTVMDYYKCQGIGAYVNGQAVKEKPPGDYLSDEAREREFRDFLRREKINYEWERPESAEEDEE